MNIYIYVKGIAFPYSLLIVQFKATSPDLTLNGGLYKE